MSCQAPAATFVVDSLVDAPAVNPGDGVCESTVGSCTLRAAVQEANAVPEGRVVIEIGDGNVYQLTLAGTDDLAAVGDLDIDGDVVIRGRSTVDAAGIDRVFDVRSGRLALEQVTVTGGHAIGGGGVRVAPDAALSLLSVEVRANNGGGIQAASGAVVSVRFSALVNNSGGPAGGIRVAGPLVMEQSTVSGNSATSAATGVGGVRVDGPPAELRYVTVTGNSGAVGGVGGPVESIASAVVNQAAGADCGPELISDGYNADSDGSCVDGSVEGDRPGVDAGLAARTTGATTGTSAHVPMLGSALVDAIPFEAAGCGVGVHRFDQWLGLRPSDSNGDGSGACEIGAVEAAPIILVNHGGDDVALDPGAGACQDASGPPGACSLRSAIDVANASTVGATVVVDPAVEVVTLARPGAGDDTNATGDLDVLASVAFIGNGTTVDADHLDRVLHFHAGNSSVTGVIITGGRVPEGGGGIRIEPAATVDLGESTVVDNAATGASARGGGLSNLGGVLTVRNTTISDNAAPGGGGGLSQMGAGASTSVTSSTIVGNWSASGGRGIHRFAGSVTVSASVLDNVAASCGSVVTSGGYNVSSDGTCGMSATGDIQSVPSLLGPLEDNGGDTPTHLPFADAPAVDRIPSGTDGLCDGTIPTDQRGVARPDGAACDAGATEGHSGTDAEPLALTVTHGNDAVAFDPGAGHCQDAGGPADACSLRSAIDVANRSMVGTVITVSPDVDLLVLGRPGTGEDDNATGDLDILRSVTISGSGSTLDAAQLDRALDVGPRATLTLTDLTITGGHAPGDGGGVRVASSGALTVEGATLAGNLATGAGGGISSNGNLQVRNSTVSENLAHSIEGGLHQGGSDTARTTVTAATVVNNVSLVAGHGLARELGFYTVQGSVLDNPGDDCGGIVGGYSGGYNVVSDTSCGFAGPGDLQDAPSAFAPLASNGGPSATHLPYLDSPVVDRIPIGTQGLCEPGSIDQRGEPRAVGPGCDSGSVEGPGTTVAPEPPILVVTHGGDQVAADPHSGTCQDASGSAGACSLRAAVDVANASLVGAMITVDADVDAIVLGGGSAGDDTNAVGDIDLRQSVHLTASGVTLDADGSERGLHILAGTSSVTGFTITGGAGGDGGGGIRIERGASLTVDDSVVTANSAGRGGGVLNAGTLLIERSTISQNVATVTGGRGGGILNDGGEVSIVESTLSGNTTTGTGSDGGGLASVSVSSQWVVHGGTLRVENSTISGNASGGRGGGVFVGFDMPSVATIVGSTVVGNTATSGAAGIHRFAGTVQIAASVIENSGIDCAGLPTSGGFNVASDVSCSFFAMGDVQDVSARLGPLLDNGGPTLTHLPHSDSPVLDRIPLGTPDLCDGTIATDQRGVLRPDGAGCDTGAVEGHSGVPA